MATHDGGSSASPSSSRPGYPLHRLVAALAPESLELATAALAAAGLGPDRVNIVTPADVSDLDNPVGGTGFRALLTRFGLSLGDEFDYIEEAQQELRDGHTLVMVLVHNDGERDQAEELLRTHGGHTRRYFGRWRVWSYGDDDR